MIAPVRVCDLSAWFPVLSLIMASVLSQKVVIHSGGCDEVRSRTSGAKARVLRDALRRG